MGPSYGLLTVVSGFSSIFLSIDTILVGITLYRRRRKFDDMTNDEEPGEAYTATLSRMKARQKSRSKPGIEVLMWASHAKWALNVDDLCYILRRVC